MKNLTYSSARAVPGDNGKPAGTEEKNVLDTADIIKHVSTVSSVCTVGRCPGPAWFSGGP